MSRIYYILNATFSSNYHIYKNNKKTSFNTKNNNDLLKTIHKANKYAFFRQKIQQKTLIVVNNYEIFYLCQKFIKIQQI